MKIIHPTLDPHKKIFYRRELFLQKDQKQWPYLTRPELNLVMEAFILTHLLDGNVVQPKRSVNAPPLIHPLPLYSEFQLKTETYVVCMRLDLGIRCDDVVLYVLSDSRRWCTSLFGQFSNNIIFSTCINVIAIWSIHSR